MNTKIQHFNNIMSIARFQTIFGTKRFFSLERTIHYELTSDLFIIKLCKLIKRGLILAFLS
jgi:hypothetical protein